jgi:outer membrane protein OmpA-like peptidoglycan-associated protein
MKLPRATSKLNRSEIASRSTWWTVAAGGYADTQLLESNETEAGKAANRRIEIVLYPKDLGGIAGQLK